MTRIIIFIVTVALLFSYIYGIIYREKKRSYYGDDERWRKIEFRASKFGFTFLLVPFVLMTLVELIVLLIPKLNIQISLANALSIGVYTIIISQLVEMGALHFFDKRM